MGASLPQAAASSLSTPAVTANRARAHRNRYHTDRQRAIRRGGGR